MSWWWLVGFTLFVGTWYCILKFLYIGMGIVTDWDPSGYRKVVSCVIKGPAGKAGIRAGDLIVRWDGIDTYACTEEARGEILCKIDTRLQTLRLGSKVEFFMHRDGHDFRVQMEAGIIRHPIPVPGVPHIHPDHVHRVQIGMRYDKRIGAVVYSVGPSAQSIDEIMNS